MKSPSLRVDREFMRAALAEAEQAAARGEVPVGAVVVRDGRIIGRGFNLREALQDPLAHAETVAIRAACRSSGGWRLSDCTLYVTLEPCVMCAGAILQARLGGLVFGSLDPKAGAVESLYGLCDDTRLNHRVPVAGGILAQESAALLESFFRNLREKTDSRSGDAVEPG